MIRKEQLEAVLSQKLDKLERMMQGALQDHLNLSGIEREKDESGKVVLTIAFAQDTILDVAETLGIEASIPSETTRRTR